MNRETLFWRVCVIGLFIAGVGIASCVAGVILSGDSDLVHTWGEVVDKLDYGGRRVFVVELDNGDFERELADDEQWYTYDIGDRMPLDVYVPDKETRTLGGALLIAGFATAWIGYFTIRWTGGKW